MDQYLSQRLQSLSESETIQMARLSRELKGRGHDVIDLSLGEPDFDTPVHIKEAAKKAIDDGYTHYTPVAGYADLREAIAAKFKRDNGLDFTPGQIVVSTGAKQSIANLMLSLLNPGDEVILPAPYWVSYAAAAQLAGGVVQRIPSHIDTDFKISPEQLEEAITPATKLLLYSSPCNPSGSVYTREELEAFSRVIERHREVLVISDEIYEYINYGGKHESIAQFDSIRDRVIVVNGVSKGFAMTGWRLGYIGAPLWIAKACDKMQGQITSGTCSITQRAALEAVTADLTPSFDMRDAFRERRDLMLGLLEDIPGLEVNRPEGAFYLFPDVSHYFGRSDGATTIEDASDFCMYVLNKAHVSIVTGKAFGVEECVRLSYAASKEQLREAVRRVKEVLGQLQ